MISQIEKARIAAGISQKEIAISLHVSTPMVSEWISGKKNPTVKHLVELSKIFDISTDFLLGLNCDEKIWVCFSNQKKIYELLSKARDKKNVTEGEIISELQISRNFFPRLKNGSLSAVPKYDIILASLYLGVKNEVSNILHSDPPENEDIPELSKSEIIKISNQLTAKMNMLNETGQKKVMEYIDDLVKSGSYSPCELKGEAM